MSQSGTKVSPSTPGQRTTPSAQASARWAGDVQRGLVGADRADLVDDDPAGKLVPELKRRHRPPALQLVQAVGDAVHLAAEGLPQPPGVAVVVAIGQHDVPGAAVALGEPVRSVRRKHRIQQHTLVLEVIRAHRAADMRMTGGPVPQPWSDFLHDLRLPRMGEMGLTVDPSTRL